MQNRYFSSFFVNSCLLFWVTGYGSETKINSQHFHDQ